MPDLTYPAAPDRQLKAYQSTPPSRGPWPGVLVIMDAFGLTDDIEAARR
jgi:carboxymethylenebutenolidase